MKALVSGRSRASKFAALAAFWVASAITPAAFAQHVANPFVGAQMYVNPDYAAEIQGVIATQTDPNIIGQLNTVAQIPTAVWLDRIAAINGSATRKPLTAHVASAVAQATAAGKVPLITLVIYDLPQRDCAALASNGELAIAAVAGPPQNGLTGLMAYETLYINQIAPVIAANPNVRFALVIEPDSIPNLVTNAGLSVTLPTCVAAKAPLAGSTLGVYETGIVYALNSFSAFPNAYTYLDIGHSAWLGWPQNAGLAVTEYTKLAQATTKGFASIDGFIDNTANYTPLKEPFITAGTTLGGTQIISALFYEFNATVDEQGYATELQGLFRAAGWPVANTNFITDTSRNGWGGAQRPQVASTSTDVNTYVNASKIDHRNHRGQWCNQMGAGMGIPPIAAPADFPQFSAYVWIKPPGESDGTYPGSANQDGFVNADPNCDPAHMNALAGNTLTGAIPNSPPAGQFFNAELLMNIANAFPPIPSVPGFTVFANPATVTQGGTATAGITVFDNGGFNGAVTLSVSGLPTGVTATLNPATISGQGSSVVTLVAAANAAAVFPPAPVNATITGTSGAITHTAPFPVTVIGNPDFSLMAAPATVTVAPNTNPTNAITVTSLLGFTGTVSVQASNLPPGLQVNFAPNSVNVSPAMLTGVITANYNVQPTVPAGTYTITITGTGTTQGVTPPVTVMHTIPVTVVVPGNGFTLTATNATVAQGGTGTSTVTVTPVGAFAGTVTLNVGALPTGVTAAFTPASITGAGTSTLTFTASATATAGAATVAITGTSGAITQTANIILTVTRTQTMDFSLTATNASVVRGSTGASTVTVLPLNGFTGVVALSVGALPAGVTAAFTPASITGTGTSVLTFTASATATLGTVPVIVTGTSATPALTHTATIMLTVSAIPDFSLAGTNATVAQGGTGASTITVTSIGGFAGAVALSVGTLPTGVTAAFAPASATTTSTLTFTATATATLGAAPVIITGVSGALTHTATITLTVTPAVVQDFSLAGTNATVAQGGTGTSTITVTPINGFAGAVALSVGALPTGVTAMFNPASTTTTSTLTFTAAATAVAATTPITVTGVSGALTHTTTIMLTVTPVVHGTVTVSTVINSNSPYYDDEGVRVSSTAPITALSITITVQNTGGLSFSGQYNTVGGSITQSHATAGTTITYQYNLTAGQTLTPGNTYLFDAQIGGTGTVHPTTGDLFTVTYTAGGVTGTQSGHF